MLRPFWVRYRNVFLVVAILCAFGISLHRSWAQYETWAGSEYTSAFLEPGYFLPYVGLKFFAPPLIALLAALALGWVATRLNRRFGERFFESDEFSALRLGVFLSGYPGFFLYLVLVFIAGILVSSAYLALKKGRAPLYYLWLPLAVLAILIQTYALPASVLDPFTIR